MDKPAKDTKATSIRISVDSVVRVLYDADTMKVSRYQGVLTEAFAFVPTYLHDLGDVGAHLLSELQKLPADHPVRSEYDWERVQRGVKAIQSGEVKVLVDGSLDKTKYEVPYELKFTN